MCSGTTFRKSSLIHFTTAASLSSRDYLPGSRTGSIMIILSNSSTPFNNLLASIARLRQDGKHAFFPRRYRPTNTPERQQDCSLAKRRSEPSLPAQQTSKVLGSWSFPFPRGPNPCSLSRLFFADPPPPSAGDKRSSAFDCMCLHQKRSSLAVCVSIEALRA